MEVRLALILAALADSLTFLVMGVAHEANPLVAAHPLLALAAKAALALALALWPYRYRFPVQLVGAVAWSIGAASNLRVLMG